MEETLIAQAAPQPELINNPGLSFLASLGSTKDMSKHNTDMFSTILSSLVESNNSGSSDVSASESNLSSSSSDRQNEDKQDDSSFEVSTPVENNDDYQPEDVAYEQVQASDDYRDNTLNTEAQPANNENKVSETEGKKTEETKDNADSKNEDTSSGSKETKEANASEGQSKEGKSKDSDGKIKVTKEEVVADAKDSVKELFISENAENVSTENKEANISDGKVEAKGEVKAEASANVLAVDIIKNIKTTDTQKTVLADDAKISLQEQDLKDEKITDADILKLIASAKDTKSKSKTGNVEDKSLVKDEVLKTEGFKESVSENIKDTKVDTKEILASANKSKITEVKENNLNVSESENKESFSENNSAKEGSEVKTTSSKNINFSTDAGKDSVKEASAKNEKQGTPEEIAAETSTKAKIKSDILSAVSFQNATRVSETQNAGEAKSVDMLAGSKSITGAQGTGKAIAGEVKQAGSSGPTSYTSNVNESKIIDQILTKARLTVKQNSKEMNLRLDPPDLGTVKMKLTLSSDNILTAKVEVSNSAVRASVNNNMNALRESLSAEGIKIDKFDVFVKDDSSNQQQNQQQNQKAANSGGLYSEDEAALDINEIKEEVLAKLDMEQGKVNFLA